MGYTWQKIWLLLMDKVLQDGIGRILEEDKSRILQFRPQRFGLFRENIVTVIPFALWQTAILRDEQGIFKRLLKWGLSAHQPTEMETVEDMSVPTASDEGLQITQCVKLARTK